MYTVLFAKQAKKDITKLSKSQRKKVRDLAINVLQVHPQSGKKLVGELRGYYSLRINITDRMVYRIDEDEKIVYVLTCKTHYDHV
jgi:Txe/YoeB family toxin of toxin-antitoxin system